MENQILFNYRHMLEEELRDRKTKNKLYSLRAFAKDLRISPAYLCKILKGKAKLGEVRSLELSENLTWEDTKKALFRQLVILEQTTDDKLITRIRNEIANSMKH